MDIIKTKLAEILKKAEIEANEKEEQIIALLIKYKYGLYAAEITRMTRFHDGMVRGHLCKLKKNGLLESREAEMLDSKEILQGYRLYIPDGYRIMSLKGEEVFFEKGSEARVSKKHTVIDQEGFRIPLQPRSGSQRSTIYKIKEKYLDELSQ